MATIYLALGSNLGDRLKYLRQAVSLMPPRVQPNILSPIYETPPWGVTDQPAFLNQVICARTQLSPRKLLDYLKTLERKMGRKKTVRYGPRVIDVDILFYDDLVLASNGLTIPHPRLAERAFVLVPLADLNPTLVHPVLGKTVSQLLEHVDVHGISLFLEENASPQE